MANYVSRSDIQYKEEFIINSRGSKLFTCRWIPVNKEPKALIFICHGYAMECSVTMKSTAIRLAKIGFAVYGIDYEGHGKSAGVSVYIENFDNIVNDCSNHFTSICEKKENQGKMRYLLGESMGGAVALLLHRMKPNYWDGAVLSAPMCKIADDMKPSAPTILLLKWMCKLFPTWRPSVSKDIVEIAFKEPQTRQEIRENPCCYKGPPCLRTSSELLKVSTDIEKRLKEVTFPFIVLHGSEDRVTDGKVSRQLFEEASSSDKTIKLYSGMWHGLLYGEPPENTDIVFRDIIGWLEKRTGRANSRLEREKKLQNDNLFQNDSDYYQQKFTWIH